MDATATLGTWKRILWQSLSFACLACCAYLLPPAAFLFACALPLVVCPVSEKGDLKFALSLPLAPAVGYLLAGHDTVFAVALVLLPYLSILNVFLRRHWHWSFSAGTAGFIAAYVLSALVIVLRLNEQLGAPVFTQLSEYAVSRVEQSPLAGSILYRLLSLGYLDVPDAYRSAAMFQVGDLIWINPPLQTELLNMLRLRLSEGAFQWIPTLLMQGSVILGLFTALATERARICTAAETQGLPSFRMLRLTKREQGYLLTLCIGTVVPSLMDQTLPTLLCLLMYAAFAAVFQLLGASVFMYILSRRHPRRLPLYGALAAALYLLFPLALFLLGMADQFIDLRASGLRFKDTNHDHEEE